MKEFHTTSSSLRMVDGPSEEAETSTKVTDSISVDSKPEIKTSTGVATTAVAKRSMVDKQPQMMEEGIYKFNKTLIDTVYNIICFLYPVRGNKRDFARFFVLETVARVPYFAYLSVMHLRETFGERDLGDKMRTHYAEADNELHHLLIMESLGGNDNIIDRTVAQTMAFFYYWYVVIIYAVNEPAAYHLSELIEDHAYDTYDGFLNNHEEMLKQMPVPDVARKYYIEDNPFLFDLFCTVKDKDEDGQFSARRPQLNSLYDVFVNIRDDEKEHWKTLCNLVQYGDMQGVENKKVRGTDFIPASN
eukprot:CAMPEP_0178953344 /NCGR_PEP_ID=MMETSP0789-20121207/8368_1 /TAXON_ID=3005 /ORGANISM="Rhizosolenia setigera, Strain CCMP 1694" /LENGTH=302 /DNA_ID=CAMNT_0020634595 /DNA_START=174 /DNA_END=1082 /DNA_ORIENTATION=-